MMLGRIDEVDGDYVATEFALGVIPTQCMYVAQTGPRATKSTGDGRLRIRKDWRSVALGYTRFWLPLFAILVPAVQLVVDGGHFTTTTLLASGALLAFAIASRAWGRLPETEKARLRVLGTVSGLRIDPARLQPHTRDIKRDLLGQLMTRAGIPITPEGVLEVLDEIPIPAMPLVFGYARYAGDTPAWRECAAIVYARYDLAEK